MDLQSLYLGVGGAAHLPAASVGGLVRDKTRRCGGQLYCTILLKGVSLCGFGGRGVLGTHMPGVVRRANSTYLHFCVQKTSFRAAKLSIRMWPTALLLGFSKSVARDPPSAQSSPLSTLSLHPGTAQGHSCCWSRFFVASPQAHPPPATYTPKPSLRWSVYEWSSKMPPTSQMYSVSTLPRGLEFPYFPSEPQQLLWKHPILYHFSSSLFFRFLHF